MQPHTTYVHTYDIHHAYVHYSCRQTDGANDAIKSTRHFFFFFFFSLSLSLSLSLLLSSSRALLSATYRTVYVVLGKRAMFFRLFIHPAPTKERALAVGIDVLGGNVASSTACISFRFFIIQE